MIKVVTIARTKYLRSYVECASTNCMRRIWFSVLPDAYVYLYPEGVLCPDCDPDRITLVDPEEVVMFP